VIEAKALKISVDVYEPNQKNTLELQLNLKMNCETD
jgi:hypothetical protein